MSDQPLEDLDQELSDEALDRPDPSAAPVAPTYYSRFTT